MKNNHVLLLTTDPSRVEQFASSLRNNSYSVDVYRICNNRVPQVYAHANALYIDSVCSALLPSETIVSELRRSGFAGRIETMV